MGKPRRKHYRLREKDARFGLRLTPADRLRLEELQDRYGMDMSALFRSWLHGTALPPPNDRQRRLLLIIENRLDLQAQRLQQRPFTTIEDLQLLDKLISLAERLHLQEETPPAWSEGGGE